jgi:hypothetical protein
MEGVAYVDGRLQEIARGFWYFEVRMDVVRTENEDGLVLGITVEKPSPAFGVLTVADEVPDSWTIGYSGLAKALGSDMMEIGWNPKDLQKGDRAGLLVTDLGGVWVVENGDLTERHPINVHPDDTSALYPFVDLLGNAAQVTLMNGAMPDREVLEEAKAEDERIRQEEAATEEANSSWFSSLGFG